MPIRLEEGVGIVTCCLDLTLYFSEIQELVIVRDEPFLCARFSSLYDLGIMW